MSKINVMCLLLVAMFVAGLCCSQQVFAEDEEGGNNLSLPVIWSDGETKVLRGDPELPTTGENYWWLWYEVVDGNEVVCNPAEGDCPDPLPDDAVPVYPQRDPDNTWQA